MTDGIFCAVGLFFLQETRIFAEIVHFKNQKAYRNILYFKLIVQ